MKIFGEVELGLFFVGLKFGFKKGEKKGKTEEPTKQPDQQQELLTNLVEAKPVSFHNPENKEKWSTSEFARKIS